MKLCLYDAVYPSCGLTAVQYGLIGVFLPNKVTDLFSCSC